MVKDTPVIFRKGLPELIRSCAASAIPFLVFSAGLYDVIKVILEDANLHPSNVHIVSNRMVWGKEDGVCVGFSEPLIHGKSLFLLFVYFIFSFK
jgi:cytosolic 5'-nucleotidase 3